MKWFIKITDKISQIAGWISWVSIVGAAIFLLAGIIMRIVGSPIKGNNEVLEFVMCIMSFTAFAYTQIKRKHIQVGFVLNKFPDRFRFIASVFNCFWCSILLGVITVAAWGQGDYALKANKASFILKVPYAPFYYICAVCMGLFCLTFVADFVKSIMAVAGNKEMREDIAKGWV